MSNDSPVAARIAAIAIAMGHSIKRPSLDYITKLILESLPPDGSPGAVRHELRKVRETNPTHFWSSDDKLAFANKSVAERLEVANAKTFADREAERAATKAALPKITFTSRELGLPPEVRAALADERLAAALAAQAKKKDGNK